MTAGRADERAETIRDALREALVDSTEEEAALASLTAELEQQRQALQPISERPCIRGGQLEWCINVLPDRATWCDRCLARAVLSAGAADTERTP